MKKMIVALLGMAVISAPFARDLGGPHGGPDNHPPRHEMRHHDAPPHHGPRHEPPPPRHEYRNDDRDLLGTAIVVGGAVAATAIIMSE